MSKNLLLEIGTEEMPANILSGVVDQLRDIAEKRMKEARLDHDKITVYATPRRLAVIINNAADRQPDETVKKRGPSIKAAFDENGNPTRAAQGFARGQHIDPSELVKEGNYTWANVVNHGKKLEDILPSIFLSFITDLNFTRPMRWAYETVHFIRPVRWIVALCGNEVIPVEFAHVKSGRLSRGHRFLHPDNVEITSPDDYKEIMRSASVIVDQDERRNLIKKGLEQIAKELGGHVWNNPGLLEEITYLVEYPTPLYGRIDQEFLKLPVPAIVTPMRDHQRYYPVRKDDGSLMPYFLTVRNGGTKGIHNVQIGNERVLRARLDDAKFFFENDRKKSLAEHREDLTRINYQENMGTMLDKADRLEKLTAEIGKDWHFSPEDMKDVKRASYLSKSDLATGMVTEFTELQGEMGKEYALLDGEKPNVAQAIFEQYMPRFAGDTLPKESIGRDLSIADKLDNLAATFLRGLIPTGSQDPFALRRQTIGTINILVDGKIHWDIRKGFHYALDLLSEDESKKEEVASQLEEFFRQRIRTIMLDEKIDYDVIDAVLAGPIDDIYAIFMKARNMIQSHIKDEVELRQAVTRLHNITKGKTAGDIREDLLTEEAEKNLYQAYKKALQEVKPLYDNYEYSKALDSLKALTDPINDYLDHVMVMVDDEDVKNNRISQLMAILTLFDTWGDFSKLA